VLQEEAETVVKVVLCVAAAVKLYGVPSSTVLLGVTIELPPAGGVTVVKGDVQLESLLGTFVHQSVYLAQNLGLVAAHRVVLQVRNASGRGSLCALVDVDDEDSDNVDVGILQSSEMCGTI